MKLNKENGLTVLIVLLYLILFLVQASTSLYDDLGFDFAGYAARAFTGFDGFWTQESNMGVPSSTFNQFLPGSLPVIFKALGLGSFTMPLGLSLLLIKLLLPLAFIFLGKFFGFSKKESILMGLVFVLNPITFKFFNRYYELVAWLFLVIAFAAYYGLLKDQKFNFKYYAIAALAAASTILSHAIPVIFLYLLFTFMITSKKDLIKAVLVGGTGLGLSAFWLIPLIWFKDYSYLGSFAGGAELITAGILASSAVLILALIASLFFFRTKRKQFPRLFQLAALTTFLALIQISLPFLPIISAPFLHSYHAFYLLVLLPCLGLMLKGKNWNWKLITPVLALACLVLIVVSPTVQRQYFFEEPRIKAIEGFNEVEKIFQELETLNQPLKQYRFAVLPNDLVLTSYAQQAHGLSSVDDFTYFSLKDVYDITHKMMAMQLDCQQFNQAIEKTGVGYWIALDENAYAYLQDCGLTTKAEQPVALFEFPGNKTIIDNGELLEFNNQLMKLKAWPPSTTLKVAFFPRWQAFSQEKAIPIENLKPGMGFSVEKETIIEVKYVLTLIDWLAILISLLTAAGFTLLLWFKPALMQ